MKLLAATLLSAALASPALAAGAPAGASRGRTLFVAACGSCHRLAAAGTHGRKGPSLAGERRSYADVVDQVVHGGGGMPAFRTSLTRRQIADIATFLARATASAPAD
jgi:mono/diheme cytochrome c family protein